MNLPKKVTVGGVAFEVKRIKIDAYGEMDFDNKFISISSDIKDNEILFETLRHEMLHAALAVCGHTWSKNYDEESIIRCLENVFFPAWKKLTKTNGL